MRSYTKPIVKYTQPEYSWGDSARLNRFIHIQITGSQFYPLIAEECQIFCYSNKKLRREIALTSIILYNGLALLWASYMGPAPD